MNPQYILVIAVLIVMGWFAVGVIYNLRRGNALLKWMQAGLPSIAQTTKFDWLGTSVVKLGMTRAKKPFRSLETLLVLRPRDVLWMTILAYFQGRSDIIIFRAQLTTAPMTDFDLVDPKSWSGRHVLSRLDERKWESKTYQGLQLVAPKGLLDLATTTLDRLAAPMGKLSPRYARFSLRRDMPNLEVHVPFPQYRVADAQKYFEALRDLARAISERE